MGNISDPGVAGLQFQYRLATAEAVSYNPFSRIESLKIAEWRNNRELVRFALLSTPYLV